MSVPFRFTEDALRDFEDAVSSLADRNAGVALRLVDELERTFYFLGNTPGAGHRRSDLCSQANIRFWNAAGFLIAYEHDAVPILLTAVLHGSRDIANILLQRPRPE